MRSEDRKPLGKIASRPDASPDMQRRPSKAEMRQGGMVAAAALVFIALFTIVIVWIA